LRAPFVRRHAGVGARALFADRLQQAAVGREFVELVVVLVAQPDDILAAFLHDADRVREPEQSSAP